MFFNIAKTEKQNRMKNRETKWRIWRSDYYEFEVLGRGLSSGHSKNTHPSGHSSSNCISVSE